MSERTRVTTADLRHAVVSIAPDIGYGKCPEFDRLTTRALLIDALRDALDAAIQVAWDGPRVTVGTDCAESYSGWRDRVERECRATLAAAKAATGAP